MTPEAEVIPIKGRAAGTRAGRAQDERFRCRATTASGRPCRNYAPAGNEYCSVHAPAHETVSPTAAPAVAEAARSDSVTENLLAGIDDFLRRRFAGEYPIDEFGYDAELSQEILLPITRVLYERYFRVRCLGVERIPSSGPALLVANHSGTVPIDALMVQVAVATEHPQRRLLRNIAADLPFRMPFIGPLARKTGNAAAAEEDAYELLRRGELVGVFPEGYKGVGKGWSERYHLQRFGRGGYIEVALRSGVPIVPVAVVGAEEAYPMIANARWLARALGFPYFPITPTFPLLGPLGLLPLPSRWIIEFGEPVAMDDFPPEAADDAMLVFDLSDRIRDTIQQMLYRNLSLRGGAFL